MPIRTKGHQRYQRCDLKCKLGVNALISNHSYLCTASERKHLIAMRY